MMMTMTRLSLSSLPALEKFNMENSPEIKNVLANFLGFAMSKSKELEGAILPGSAVSKAGSNIDHVITKAATEVEQKFGANRPNFEAPRIEATFDVASALIPMPDGYLSTVSEAQKTPVVQYTPPVDDNQLEFSFVEPNSQTKLILDEIKLLNSKVYNIIRLLEREKNPVKRSGNKKTTSNQ